MRVTQLVESCTVQYSTVQYSTVQYLEQHVESWVSGIVGLVATKFLFSVDRNIVARGRVVTGSSSVIARCNISA